MTADLHLQRQAWANRPALRDDAFFAFTQIVDYALAHKLPVLAAGDLFDKRHNESEPIAHFSSQMDRMQAAEIPFYYIQGDHDKAQPPWPSVHPWATHMHHMAAELMPAGQPKSVVVVGLDYQPAGELQKQLDELGEQATGAKYDKILMTHQKWVDLMGGQAICNGSFSDISEYQYVLNGDLHKHLIHRGKNKEGSRLIVWSPGATCLQAIDEPDLHQFFVLYSDMSVRDVTMRQRARMRTNILRTPGELSCFIADIPAMRSAVRSTEAQDVPETLHKAILEVHYYVDIPDAAARIVDAVGDSFHLFEKQYFPETVELELERKHRDAIIAGGLHGALDQLEPDPTRNALYRRLLDAANGGLDEAKKELQRQRQEFGL